jgi:hypothetical protein
MFMKASFLILILLVFCYAGPETNVARKQSSSDVSNTEKFRPEKDSDRGHFTYEIISSPENSYGYNIYRDGRLFIHQPHRPALQGNEGFKTKADARKVAQTVLSKVQKGELPPSISMEELKDLEVIK